MRFIIIISISMICGACGISHADFDTLSKKPRVAYSFFYGGIPKPDISRKQLSDLIKKGNVVRVIVLSNKTSAPDDLHIMMLERVLDKDPVVESLWEENRESGKLESTKKFLHHEGYFTVVFETKSKEYIGFQMKRDLIRVVTNKFDGIALRDHNMSLKRDRLTPAP